MAEYNWRELMTQWSHEMLASKLFAQQLNILRQEYPGSYTDEVIASGWLGYPGATDEQIATSETRLGLILPPDYRAFLQMSNGWRITGPFIPRLRPVEEVDWLSSTDPDLVKVWQDVPAYEDNDAFHEGKDIASTVQISDVEYAGTAVYLLNPEVVSQEGEWESWFMAHWVPGADVYASFWEMMNQQYASFRSVEG